MTGLAHQAERVQGNRGSVSGLALDVRGRLGNFFTDAGFEPMRLMQVFVQIINH